MKKILFSNLLVVGLISIFCLSSCGVWNLGAKVKQLELGMTKQEVVSILGTRYTSLGAIATPDGNLETISYIGDTFNDDYTIRLLNGELVEWFAGKPNMSAMPVAIPIVE